MPFLVDSGRECRCLVEEMPQARVERATRGLGNQSGFLMLMAACFYVLISVGVVGTCSCCEFRSVGLLWGCSVSTMLARTLDPAPNT